MIEDERSVVGIRIIRMIIHESKVGELHTLSGEKMDHTAEIVRQVLEVTDEDGNSKFIPLHLTPIFFRTDFPTIDFDSLPEIVQGQILKAMFNKKSRSLYTDTAQTVKERGGSNERRDKTKLFPQSLKLKP